MKTLEITNLSYKYPKTENLVLNRISFSAAAGEITVLIGANGAGKTTLLRSLTNHSLHSDAINIDGTPIDTISAFEFSKLISYLTQENPQLSSLSVFEVVLLGRLNSLGLRLQEEDLEKAWNTLDSLHLRPFASRPFYALSGGQRKLVSIAQAIVKEPKILILDEPTANLDMQNKLEVVELISAYTKARNTVTLVTLHDLNLASQFADKLILLKKGELFRQGTPSEVITEAAIREAYGVETTVKTGEAGIPHLHLLRSVRNTPYHFNR